jgi:predicted pyridoxine 5'-phosphate oxidase superfamily flavin-nucleotide-binding protein
MISKEVHMLPQEILDAWADRQPAAVLTTVSEEGIPNSIWVMSTGLYRDEQIIIADNYFDKTKANLLSTGVASLLFITREGKSYQLKGTISYHTDGPFYAFMREVTPPKFPRHAAAVLHVGEIYSGSERLL